jgi:hypothetical protein
VTGLCVEFERSGGLAGITLTTRVRGTDLPAEQAAELERLVAEAGHGTPTDEPAAQPDRFRYRLRISGSTSSDCDIGLAEESLNPAQARLLDRLTDIALQRGA